MFCRSPSMSGTSFITAMTIPKTIKKALAKEILRSRARKGGRDGKEGRADRADSVAARREERKGGREGRRV